MRLRFLATAVAVLSGLRCDTNPADPELGAIQFRAGQRWLYTHDSALRDSLGRILYSSHDSLEVRVISTAASLHGRTGLVWMEARSLLRNSPASTIDTERVWYSNSASSLTEVAYQNPAAVPVVVLRAAGPAFRPSRTSFFHGPSIVSSEARSDSAILRDDPRIVLKYPLKKGSAWQAFSSPFPQVREVVGIEDVTAAGLTASAAKIKTTMPIFGPDIEWFDWVSPDGLMARRITLSVVLANEQNPESLGRAESIEHLNLITLDTPR